MDRQSRDCSVLIPLNHTPAFRESTYTIHAISRQTTADDTPLQSLKRPLSRQSQSATAHLMPSPGATQRKTPVLHSRQYSRQQEQQHLTYIKVMKKKRRDYMFSIFAFRWRTKRRFCIDFAVRPMRRAIVFVFPEGNFPFPSRYLL